MASEQEGQYFQYFLLVFNHRLPYFDEDGNPLSYNVAVNNAFNDLDSRDVLEDLDDVHEYVPRFWKFTHVGIKLKYSCKFPKRFQSKKDPQTQIVWSERHAQAFLR